MTTKTIYEYIARGPRHGWQAHEVDLDTLSETGRLIAEHIVDTCNTGIAGQFLIERVYTPRERMEKGLIPFDQEQLTFLGSIADEYERLRWVWDPMRRGESITEYVERHARDYEKFGWRAMAAEPCPQWIVEQIARDAARRLKRLATAEKVLDKENNAYRIC